MKIIIASLVFIFISFGAISKNKFTEDTCLEIFLNGQSAINNYYKMWENLRKSTMSYDHNQVLLQSIKETRTEATEFAVIYNAFCKD